MSKHRQPVRRPAADGRRGGRAGRLDPHEHHWFAEPTKEVGPKYVGGLVFAQFVFFVALLGPAIIGIGVKVQSIVPDAQKTPALGTVAGFGALFAVIGNVLFGRLSDRTTSRWGRRRPWIVGGTVVMTIAFVVMALAPDRRRSSPRAGAWPSSARTRRWLRSSPPSPTRCRSSSAAASRRCSASRRTSASSAAPTSPSCSPTSW